MALILADRVQQTGVANTTVSFTLSGSVTGFQSFAVVGNGNTTYYSATDASGNWEVGLGTYSTTGPTLTRTTIIASSNTGSAVTFSGTVNVFVTYPAEQAALASNNPGTSGYVLTSNGTGVAPTWNILSVAGGGTNASTASITSFNNITGYTATGATGTTSTNLVFSTSPALTTPTSTGAKETQSAISASAIDLTLGNYFTKTISGTTTFTISNTASSGTVNSFILDLTNGGSATVNWWSGVKWAGGTAPTLTSSGRDVLGFFTEDGGTTWNGFVLGKAMA